MVKRYDFALRGDSNGPRIEREEASSGVYVEFTDYEHLQCERDVLRSALERISSECSDDLSGRAKRYIDELLAKGADHER